MALKALSYWNVIGLIEINFQKDLILNLRLQVHDLEAANAFGVQVICSLLTRFPSIRSWAMLEAVTTSMWGLKGLEVVKHCLEGLKLAVHSLEGLEAAGQGQVDLQVAEHGQDGLEDAGHGQDGLEATGHGQDGLEVDEHSHELHVMELHDTGHVRGVLYALE